MEKQDGVLLTGTVDLMKPCRGFYLITDTSSQVQEETPKVSRKRPNYSKLSLEDIWHAGWPIRELHYLHSHGIYTLGDWCAHGKERLKHIGPKTKAWVEELMEDYNLQYDGCL